MKRIAVLIVCLFLAGLAAGQSYDRTPRVRHYFGGNCPEYTGVHNYTIKFLAQVYDGSSAGSINHFAIRDTANAHGKYYAAGKYASSQEMSLIYAAGANPGYNYAQRMLDTADHWLVIFSSGYVAGLGKPDSILFVHYGDDMTSLTQQVGGSRVLLMSALDTERKRRFCYQQWGNLPGNEVYPNGYLYLANGYNDTTRWAIANAYVRRFYEFAMRFDGDTIDAIFMDNQYRDTLGPMGYMPTFSSYYTTDSTRGGQTSWLDWKEQPGIRGGVTGMEGYDSCTKYFDHSTAMIDSVLMKSLDSMGTVTGHHISIEANVNCYRSRDLKAVAPYVDEVELEKCGDYDAKHPTWTEWYKFDSIMITLFPGTRINWQTSAERMMSSNPAAWNYDSLSVWYANYAFLLSVWDTNASMSIDYFYDTTWWQYVYEVDMGIPVELAKKSDTTGTGDATKFVTKRRFILNGDTNIVVFRTGPMSQASVNDSILVSLGAYYYRVGVRGDTAGASQNQAWLHPFDGFIGISNAEPSLIPTISATPSPLSFTAPAGGPDPQTQTLYITNTGGGTLNWTLTDDVDWLWFSATSGTGNGTSVVTVSVTGLAARTYSATITVTDPAATNSPVFIPVSLVVTMDLPVEGVPHSTVQGAKVMGGIWK